MELPEEIIIRDREFEALSLIRTSDEINEFIQMIGDEVENRIRENCKMCNNN